MAVLLLVPFATLSDWTNLLMPFRDMASLLAACLHSVGFEMPRVHDVVPLLDVDCVVEALTRRLQGTGSGSLYCPRAAPTQGVVSCTYEQWFEPYSPRRRYCQLPVSGRRMQRFLQFRLGCHGLPVAIGRLAGAGHVDWANRGWLACNSGASVMRSMCCPSSFEAAACRLFHTSN